MSLMRNFNDDFDAIVRDYGSRLAFVSTSEPNTSLTYADVARNIDRHLAWFSTLGLREGDCVGALCPNSAEMLTLFLASLRAGLRFAPLACDSSPHDVVAWADLTKPVCCFCGSIIHEDLLKSLETLSIRILLIQLDGGFRHLPETAARSVPASNGAKIYLYSSGTTGHPKAIVIDGNKLWSAGFAFTRAHDIDYSKPFRIWNYLPQSYLGGLFNLCLIPISVAGTIVVDESFSGKTLLGFWQNIDRYEINALWLVPTIVRGLLSISVRTRRHELRNYGKIVNIAFLGTAPIEIATKEQFEQIFGIELIENYALSETTFLTSELVGEKRSQGSVGRVLPYAELRFRAVVDDDDPRYREILAKTPFLADGYLGLGGRIVSDLVDGFLPTGDLGYVNSSGCLIVTGRCKDIIKKGGHFVALRESELIAASHPAVSEAVAVPIAHSFYGESYRLLVQLKPSTEPGDIAAVSAFVLENLAKHKWPDSIDAVTEFPRTPSGKVRKFLLQD